jgi:hypothetical protein
MLSWQTLDLHWRALMVRELVGSRETGDCESPGGRPIYSLMPKRADWSEGPF